MGFLGFWGFRVLGVWGFWGFGVLGFWGFGVLGFWDLGCRVRGLNNWIRVFLGGMLSYDYEGTIRGYYE